MIKYHDNVEQGSDAWMAMRCGVLTASEMKLILTPTLKIASNDKEKRHLYELLAQRITKHVEPAYISDAMLRGQVDEIEARALYAKKYAPVREVGFVTNNRFGFKLGGSPDGLVGEDGGIECKSRIQALQIETIANHVVPDEHVLQVQTLLLITQRKWWDYVSYSAGLPMVTIRVYPDEKIQTAIAEAAIAFEARLQEKMEAYRLVLKAKGARLIKTKRKPDQMEITL